MTSGRAVLWAVAASIAFGLTSFVSKQASQALDATQVGFMRYAIGLAFVAALVVAGRVPRPSAWGLLVLRGMLGGGAGLLYYASLNHLPVGTATFLNCTSPVFAAAFAAVTLGERLRGSRLIAFAASCAGMTAVLVGQGAALGGPLAWQGTALLSGVVAGAAVVTVRAARRTESVWTIFAFFAVFGALCTAPFAIEHWRWPDESSIGEAYAWAIVGGLLSVFAQIALTISMTQIEVPVAAGVSQLNFITSLVLGMIVLDERLSILSAAGATVTLAGIVSLAWPSGNGMRG